MNLDDMTDAEKIELAEQILDAFSKRESKKNSISVELDKMCREKSGTSVKSIGPTMTMEEATKKLEEMHPEAELDENEEIIWECPETPFAEKRKTEIMDDLDAQVLMEEIEAGWQKKKDLEALAEAEFLVECHQEKVENLRKSLEDAE